MALAGLVIAASGSGASLMKLVKDNGGTFAHMITASITHLITTEDEVRASSYKVSKADEHGAILVTEKWLQECVRLKKRVDERPFLVLKAAASEPSSVFTYESDFVSEAELKEQQEKEQAERDARKKAAEAAEAKKKAQPIAAPAPAQPKGVFGFGGSGFGFGAAAPAATAFPAPAAAPSSQASSSPQNERARRTPWAAPKGIAPKVKAWPDNDPNRPAFTDDWEVEYYETLQWTDVSSNHNKYYCLELHIGKNKGKQVFRLYTHYGRTDDLAKNPKSGRRENRFYATLDEAEDAFAALIQEKTITKGYRKVELVHSNIGSDKLRTLVSELAAKAESKAKAHAPASSNTFVDTAPISEEVSDLVKYIYDEASAALTNTLGQAKITSLGIETPLGVVNIAQIEKGEAILQQLYEHFKFGTADEQAINDLTNQFYTVIPHNLGGRARAQVVAMRLTSMAQFEEKQDLLQLMRDMLNVTADGKSMGGAVSDTDMKYRALRSKIELISPTTEPSRFEEARRLVLSTQGNHEALIEIERIYSIQRPQERTAFIQNRIQSNQHTLFHGSRISNYVGLLSRGLMMPKMVVAMGGKRRDGGLLGNGIYFGDSAATSAQYCTPGSKGSRLMLLNNVALGTVKDYEQVAFGLMEPPQGFHSVHGVRSTPEHHTDFKDDEYVIFNPAQQFQQYLVEFKLKRDLEEFVTSQLFHNADGSSSVQLKSGAAAPVSATPTSSSQTSAQPSSFSAEEVSKTVDDIFATVMASASTSSAQSSTSTSTKLGSSLKPKLNTGSSAFSSMSRPTSGLGESLKLQPSTLQTTGLLKPSGLSVSSSGPLGSNSLKLQPSGLTTGNLQGSLKLQPSGLTTSVKVAPLGSSFGRKSGGQTDPYAAAPSNVLQLQAPDPSLATGVASGAAAVLNEPAKDPSEMTEEEKERKRAAMKMGGKNWGSKLTAASSSASTTDATPAAVPPYTQTGYSSDTYSNLTEYATDDTDARRKTEVIEEPRIPSPTPTPAQPVSSLPSSTKSESERQFKKRPLDDRRSGVETPVESFEPPKKVTYGGPLSAPQKKPLSATSTGFTSAFAPTSFNWTPLSASATASSSSAFGTSSFKYSSTVGLSSSSLSGSAFPSVRTAVTTSTVQSKLSTFVPKAILKEKLAECKIRALYSTDRSSVLLKDHVMLNDVFKKRDQYRNSLESEEETNMPKLLTRHRISGPLINSSVRAPFGVDYDPETQGQHIIVDRFQFISNFALLTNNLFVGLDMKHLVFFGDLVVGALLQPTPDHHVGNDASLESKYRDSDIQMAIYGLEGEAANQKLKDIFFAVQSATKASCDIVRTNDEIIIIAQFPIRNIRIPLRSFKGPAEVILRQNVDITCVGFDGTTVWALSRFQRAITKRYNLVDLALKHTTYEVQLYKWACRGFAVAVPGFQRHLVTPHLYQQKPWQVRGLAKLLLFEAEMNEKWRVPTKAGEIVPCEPWAPKHQRFAIYSRDEYSLMSIHEFQAKQFESYSSEHEDIDQIEIDHHRHLFVPWGPQWRVSRVVKHLSFANREFYRHSGSADPTLASHLLCFGVEAVLKGPSAAPADDDDSIETLAPKSASVTSEALTEAAIKQSAVSGSIVWSTSRQNQIAEEADDEWYREAYCVAAGTVEMLHTITNYAFCSDFAELGKLLRKLPRGFDVNHPSSYTQGRTALCYAALFGSSEAISALIAKGAQPGAMDPASGLYPIHFAAFSGNASAVDTLLHQPSVDINCKTRDQKWTPLHFAAYHGHIATLQALLGDTKIRLNPRDKGGRSPVFVAAYAGHVKCLEMLKAAGAKMDTKAPPKEPNGITGIEAAAKNGHAEARTFLINLLKPDFPPPLQPTEEALSQMVLIPTTNGAPVDTIQVENTANERAVASATELAEWASRDKSGQTLLHYAARYGEVALVKQLVHKTLEEKGLLGGNAEALDVALDPEIAVYRGLIDLSAENMFGQTALYYAQHTLDGFVGGKLLEEGDVAGSIEALGMPSAAKARAAREILDLLTKADVKPGPLMATRTLPSDRDDVVYKIMIRLAKKATQRVREAASKRQQREMELRAEEERMLLASVSASSTRKSVPRTPSSLRRKNSNELTSSGRIAPHTGLSPPPRSPARLAPGVRPFAGVAFDFSGSGASASTAPTTIEDLATSNDTAQLLVTISQMHKSRQLNDAHRHVLKSLALKQDRSLLAALRAFQQDHVSLAFGMALQQIAVLQTRKAAP